MYYSSVTIELACIYSRRLAGLPRTPLPGASGEPGRDLGGREEGTLVQYTCSAPPLHLFHVAPAPTHPLPPQASPAPAPWSLPRLGVVEVERVRTRVLLAPLEAGPSLALLRERDREMERRGREGRHRGRTGCQHRASWAGCHTLHSPYPPRIHHQEQAVRQGQV